MNANPILLQKKYARIVELFAENQNISREEALDYFYHSLTYQLMRDGVSDLHCMSDGYLSEEIKAEFVKEKQEAEKILKLRKVWRFTFSKTRIDSPKPSNVQDAIISRRILRNYIYEHGISHTAFLWEKIANMIIKMNISK